MFLLRPYIIILLIAIKKKPKTNENRDVPTVYYMRILLLSIQSLYFVLFANQRKANIERCRVEICATKTARLYIYYFCRNK